MPEVGARLSCKFNKNLRTSKQTKIYKSNKSDVLNVALVQN